MKLSHKIRKVWHDWFSANATKKQVAFALSCQDVTCEIDLRKKRETLRERFRFWLHLSFCQACKNYYEFSNALGRAVRKKKPHEPVRIQEMNAALVEKYSSKDKSRSVH